MTLPVSFDDVLAAAARLRGVAHRTPVVTSTFLNQRTGASVFLKAENLQRIGAFKFRGGYNAVKQFTPEQRRGGVTAFSSGNHAQAIALAARIEGIPATIVMPHDAPAIKITATRGYGAEVILYNRETESREEIARKLAEERGMTLVPPYDHCDVIAGQGTAALELLEDQPELDYLYVCVGGGGLISGCALAARAKAPNCRVIGVEPAAGDDATRSFHTGVLQTVHNPDTIADGARTASLGKLTFPLVRACVDDMMTVTDGELLDAMQFLWERTKLVVEPTGALAVAGLLKRRHEPGARIGAIISGGNVDVAGFFELLRRE